MEPVASTFGRAILCLVEAPGWRSAPVDISRPHFEVVHSLFKQTVARVGRGADGEPVALEFLLGDDPQAGEAREKVVSDLAAKLERLAPAAETLAALFDLLERSCCHPSNLYTEVHWLPVRPGCPEPGG